MISYALGKVCGLFILLLFLRHVAEAVRRFQCVLLKQ